MKKRKWLTWAHGQLAGFILYLIPGAGGSDKVRGWMVTLPGARPGTIFTRD